MENLKLFTIPASETFLPLLAAYILGKGYDPLQLADTHIILPTERACRQLEEELTPAHDAPPLMMPHIKPITGWIQPSVTSARVIPFAQRHLLLSHLLQEKTAFSWQECFSLATSLIQLMDRLHLEEIPLEKLDKIIPEELSGHWQRSLDILCLLSQEWPLRLKSLGLEDPLPARTRAFEQQAQVWRKTPPKGSVIAAGLVGSVPSVARFLKAISTLPRGEIIFIGLDLEMKEEEWQSLPLYHPFYGIKQTLERMGCPRKNIRYFPMLTQNKGRFSPPLTRFLKNLFASETLQSPSLQECLQEKALESIFLTEAESLQEEARLIALMIREALNNPHERIALVTPHRGLSDRVVAELKRWKIIPNDSYGESLAASPLGAFMALSLKVALHPQDTIAVLSLLKHPLTLLGLHPAECRKKARLLEIRHLRFLSPFEKPDFQKMQEVDDASFYAAFSQALEPLSIKETSLEDWVRRHRAALENLAYEEKMRLWQGKEKQPAIDLLHHLEKISLPNRFFTLGEYASLLSLHLKKIRITKTYGMHSRVHILGPFEARMLNFDCIILGAMNDLHWAQHSQPDPWLSHEMKKNLGLPDEHYQVGLKAADWVQLLHAKRVILTRARREGGLMMFPSRWLMRLEAILKSQRSAFLLESPHLWKKWAQNLDLQQQASSPCKRPAPSPPVFSRPRKLSVTEVQLWIQDPYALYAKKILRLTPLPPLIKEMTPAVFGIVVHRTLEKYINTIPERQTRDHLLHCGRQAFGSALEHAMIQALWWPRFVRLCDWFLEEEKKRHSQISASWTEVKGSLTIDAPKGVFTLIAKADRIDVLKNGALEIIDYKTGNLPSYKAVLQGEAVQLPLEAAITRHGSWQHISGTRLAGLSFWQIKGGIPPGLIMRLEEGEKIAEKAFANLAQMVFLFDQQITPYQASAQNCNEYDLLARRQEWSR